MQDLLEVNGIVLSSMPIGEADRRVLLLTKELGKISAFVRGARKPTSMLGGSVRPFAFGTFYVYPGQSAYSVNRADVRTFFEGVAGDVGKTAYGCYFMELAGYFTHEGAPAGEELLLLYYSLKALENEHIPDALVRRVFEIRLMQLEGVAPDFRVCSCCGTEPSNGFFKPSFLNLLCPECYEKRSGNAASLSGNRGAGETKISSGTLRALRFLASTPAQKLFTFSVSPEMLDELAAVAECLLERNIDRALPARDMLSVLV